MNYALKRSIEKKREMISHHVPPKKMKNENEKYLFTLV